MQVWRQIKRKLRAAIRPVGLLSVAFGVGLAALFSGTAAAQAVAEEKKQPGLCEMARAFDEALRMRYYRANLAPDQIGCNFLGAEGCSYTLRRRLVIKVTHLEPVGCDASGECAFRARQVCEIGEQGASCSAITATPTSDYIVAGRFAPNGEKWRLTDWRREPSGPLAAEARVAVQCPQIL